MNLYGVFVGKQFGMVTNKRVAIKAAKQHKGFVTWMPYPHDTGAWDGPTFRVCSWMLADYR